MDDQRGAVCINARTMEVLAHLCAAWRRSSDALLACEPTREEMDRLQRAIGRNYELLKGHAMFVQSRPAQRRKRTRLPVASSPPEIVQKVVKDELGASTADAPKQSLERLGDVADLERAFFAEDFESPAEEGEIIDAPSHPVD